MSPRTGRLLALLVLLLGGCAHRSQYAVKRWWLDWNSERQLNAQVECFDHLPLKPTRVRLIRWGYNVGPQEFVAADPSPSGWRTRQGGLLPWTGVRIRDGVTSEGYPAMAPSVPSRSAPPSESIPRLPPPAPPSEEKNRSDGEQGPQGKPLSARHAAITQAGYRPAPPEQPQLRSNPTWMFTPSQPAPWVKSFSLS